MKDTNYIKIQIQNKEELEYLQHTLLETLYILSQQEPINQDSIFWLTKILKSTFK